jgi:hypothetical protein
MPGGKKKVGDLQIDQDMEFQEKSWKVQRAAWVFFAILITAGLLGIFGEGPVSASTTNDNQGLEVSYERFWRMGKELELRFLFQPQAPPEGKLSLFIGREYLQDFHIRNILPEPDSVSAVPGGYLFEFNVRGDEPDFLVVFTLMPDHYGSYAMEVGQPEGQRLVINQLVFP